MNADQLLSDLYSIGYEDLARNFPPDHLLKFLATYLADNLHECRLSNGAELADLGDVIGFFREVKEAAKARISAAKPKNGLRVARIFDPCPDCGHVHIDSKECGFQIGGGRTCRCERAVTA